MEKQAYQKSLYVPNPITTRSVQIRRYLEFIEDFDGEFTPVPCLTSHLNLDAAWLARIMKYSSVTNHRSRLNFFLKRERPPPIDYTQFDLTTRLPG